jgi:hypothetical protein
MTRSKKLILKRKKGGRGGGRTNKWGGYRLFGRQGPGTSYGPDDPDPPNDPNAKPSWFSGLFGSSQTPQTMSLSSSQQEGVVPGSNISAPNPNLEFMSQQNNPYDDNPVDTSTLSGLGNGGNQSFGVGRTDTQVGETFGVNPDGTPYSGMGGSRRRRRRRPRSRRHRR